MIRDAFLRHRLSPPSPSPVGIDPLRASRPGPRKWQVKDRNPLAGEASPADRYDLIGLVQVEFFHRNLHPEYGRLERHRQIFFHHGEDAADLFRSIIAIHGGFSSQIFQMLGEGDVRAERALRLASRPTY